jgi:hypothetical protein
MQSHPKRGDCLEDIERVADESEQVETNRRIKQRIKKQFKKREARPSRNKPVRKQ